LGEFQSVEPLKELSMVRRRFGRAARITFLQIAILMTLATVACGGQIVVDARVGDRVDAVIRSAGPPSRSESLDSTNGRMCENKRATRVISYDLPTSGFRAFLRKYLTRMQPDMTITICVDSAGAIVQTYQTLY
jgi:hypothetical protein